MVWGGKFFAQGDFCHGCHGKGRHCSFTPPPTHFSCQSKKLNWWLFGPKPTSLSYKPWLPDSLVTTATDLLIRWKVLYKQNWIKLDHLCIYLWIPIWSSDSYCLWLFHLVVCVLWYGLFNPTLEVFVKRWIYNTFTVWRLLVRSVMVALKKRSKQDNSILFSLADLFDDWLLVHQWLLSSSGHYKLLYWLCQYFFIGSDWFFHLFLVSE